MMKPKKQTIIVGLSGGVDSAVAAYLLKKQGHTVRAVFMKNFSGKVGKLLQCPWKEDRQSAYQVASFLDIPIETWDLEKHYRHLVIDYLYKEYQRGLTPNPDIRCNSEIKFKIFQQLALKKGADAIATGHYARVTKRSHYYHLHKGVDPDKDQSYFLAELNQQQLARSLFPLGALTKPKVRAMAKKIGLPNYDRPDSQGICFVGEVKMIDFLKAKIKPKAGNIVDMDGNILGRHQGVYYYTIGQRKGLDLGGGPARYVIRKDIKKNLLVVGESNADELFSTQLTAHHWHWLGQTHKLPLRAKAKIRYRQDDQACEVIQLRGKNASIQFNKPQRAITSGQTVAIYKSSELIASAVIS